jgi:hypothetical protein
MEVSKNRINTISYRTRVRGTTAAESSDWLIYCEPKPWIKAASWADSAAVKSTKGGRTGVMGKQGGAAPSRPGEVSPGGHSGDNTFKVSGGKGHMAGFTPAANAKPR